VIEKRGSFYTVGEQRIGQGRENARQTLKDNPALLQDLEMKVRAGGSTTAPGAALEGGAEDGDE
jgi:recombination protein RecA